MSRARYADAGQAMRDAMDRLSRVEVTGKTLNYSRIVSWVICRVGSYSRIADQISRKEAADVFGVDLKTISRALRWGVDQGVIGWTDSGPRGAWTASLLPAVAMVTPGQIDPAPLDTSPPDVSTTEKKTNREENIPQPPAIEPQAAPADQEGRINLELEKTWGNKLTATQRAELVADAVGLLGRFTERQVINGLTCERRGVRRPVRALQTRISNPHRWFTSSTTGGAPSPREAFEDGARIVVEWAA